jgi:hypothetical protein
VIGDRRSLSRLGGGGHVYELVDDAVRVEGRHLYRERGHVYAETTVIAPWAGVKNPLSSSIVNISSQAARKSLAKYCGERAKTKPTDFDWHDVIDSACIAFIEADQQGDTTPIALDDAPEIVEREYDIYGLQVPADGKSLLIAHRDSMKSMLQMLTLGTLAQRGIPSLYTDFEWAADRHRGRKHRLFGLERLPHLHYLRCHAPLVIEADRIRRYCDEHHIAFIAIDSIGLACDGPLKDDDVAIRFHRLLDSLPPSLSSAHVPKSSLGPDGKGDAIGRFGSVFFANLCRMSWLVKKQPGATDDVVSVGLFPQKQNDGSRVKPAGLEFTFSADRIHVRNVNLATVEGLAERLSVPDRMKHLLKSGPLTIARIAEELDAKTDTIIKAANRNKAFTKVLSADGIQRIALVERRIA